MLKSTLEHFFMAVTRVRLYLLLAKQIISHGRNTEGAISLNRIVQASGSSVGFRMRTRMTLETTLIYVVAGIRDNWWAGDALPLPIVCFRRINKILNKSIHRPSVVQSNLAPEILSIRFAPFVFQRFSITAKWHSTTNTKVIYQNRESQKVQTEFPRNVSACYRLFHHKS